MCMPAVAARCSDISCIPKLYAESSCWSNEDDQLSGQAYCCTGVMRENKSSLRLVHGCARLVQVCTKSEEKKVIQKFSRSSLGQLPA